MIVVDVETTGLDPQKHSIVSIGTVDFSNPENRFYQECCIWDGAEVTPEALEVNGFTEEDVRDPNKKTLEKVIKEFFEWIKNIEDKTIAGQDPAFDKSFLQASAERYGIEWKLGHRTVDLHSVCYFHYLKRGLVPPTKEGRTALNLDKIANYVGLPDESKPHHALNGAKLEAEAFSRFIYGKPLFGEFAKFSVPNYLL